MLEIDVNEPKEAAQLISTTDIPYMVSSLNVDRWADYRWKDSAGRWTNVERKTWSEILANVDAVEDQLRRHMHNQPDARLIFILEGFVDVDSKGTYPLKQRKNVWVRSGYRSGTRISRVYSWLYNASSYLEVFQTGNFGLTMQFIAQAYKQDQKTPDQHKTFNRYYKKATFSPNPQVSQLIGLMSGLGEVRAESLIAKFTTVWNVLSAQPEELMQVHGIGEKMATTMLQRIGRTDV